MKRTAPYFSDQALLCALQSLLARDRTNTAELLDHIAEVDSRKLFVPAAYPSMFAYCVEALHLSEDSAYKRIQAARAAAQFPAILGAVADGRLHLSAVCLLAPHLTTDNVAELVDSATHQSKSQIERMLAERFPSPDLPSLVRAIPVPAPASQLAPGQVQAPPAADRARVQPLAPERFAVQFTWSGSANAKMRYLQELLSHEMGPNDLARLFEHVLDLAIPLVEKRKFAATESPRSGRTSSVPRHIPAGVKRAVWERDGGQCTYVSESGHRCEARRFLEFDHELEVARGGEASASNIRLLCHAHNQHAAERTFGPEFMRRKRIAAAEARDG